MTRLYYRYYPAGTANAKIEWNAKWMKFNVHPKELKEKHKNEEMAKIRKNQQTGEAM